MNKNSVFTEMLNGKKGYYQSFDIQSILYETKTAYQKIEIFENAYWGRILVLDGIIQLSELDEFIYHEMMTHLPVIIHGHPRNVLVIGGGDGGIIRELLKHTTIEQIKLVEIDEEVISSSKKYLPKVSNGAFDDQRIKIIVEDGKYFINNSNEKFDIIILDGSDPIGCAEVLFSSDFYASCKDLLNPEGIMLTQTGVNFFQFDQIELTMSRYKALFNDCNIYAAPAPVYAGGPLMIAIGTDKDNFNDIPLDILYKRYEEAKLFTKYYNPKIHQSAFSMPNYMLNSLLLPKKNPFAKVSL